MKKIFIAAAMIAASAGIASAADQNCTAENAQSKALELSTALQTLAATNPTRMQEIATEMQAKATEAQTSGDLAGLCAYYDELIDEVNS